VAGETQAGRFPNQDQPLTTVTLASFGRFRVLVTSRHNPYGLTLALFGRFRVLVTRPRVSYRVTLASFGRFRVLVTRPQVPYRVTLASFGRFRVLVTRPQVPYRVTLASFGRFRLMLRSQTLLGAGPGLLRRGRAIRAEQRLPPSATKGAGGQGLSGAVQGQVFISSASGRRPVGCPDPLAEHPTGPVFRRAPYLQCCVFGIAFTRLRQKRPDYLTEVLGQLGDRIISQILFSRHWRLGPAIRFVLSDAAS